MHVILLGTSAAVPTPLRRPAATALVREGEILLFDCGEGTQMQFQKAGLKPGKLSKIFISHFHGDHFYGLIGLLTTLQLGGRAKALQLYGPVGLKKYIEFMKELSQFDFGFDLTIHEYTPEAPQTNWDLGEYGVQARPLDHGIPVLGFRLEEKPRPGKFDVEEAQNLGIPDGPIRGKLQQGQSVVLPDGRRILPEQVVGGQRAGKTVAICSDTRPCANSVALAQDVDLLIHEGTFDESQAELAQMTQHSTVTQAAEVARDARAKRLVLTHISQRYKESDQERLLLQAKRIFPKTILGKDLMRIQI